MRLLANIVSIVLHPLLMVTYGIILALMFTYLAIYPLVMKVIIVGGVFSATALIPGLFIFLMVKNGSAGDLELSNKKERLIPYLILITSNIACLLLMYKLKMPYWMLWMMIAAIASLIVSFGINFYWKISAHMLGIGGLLGAVLGICRIQMMNPYQMFILGFIFAGMLGVSRIFLGRHTPMQVYAGFSLGFVFTFTVSLLSYIYLFI